MPRSTAKMRSSDLTTLRGPAPGAADDLARLQTPQRCVAPDWLLALSPDAHLHADVHADGEDQVDTWAHWHDHSTVFDGDDWCGR